MEAVQRESAGGVSGNRVRHACTGRAQARRPATLPGTVQAPLHLREDFCGSALVCVTWCKGDVFRSAVGLDLDPEPLRWGMANNAPLLGGGGPSQLLLLECNVSAGAVLVLATAATCTNRPNTQLLLAGCSLSTASAYHWHYSVPPAFRMKVLDDPATAAEIPHLPSSSGNDSSSTAAAAETEAGGEAAAKTGADADEEGSASLWERPADIVCALNFGVCLLHRRRVGAAAAAVSAGAVRLQRAFVRYCTRMGTHPHLPSRHNQPP